MFIFFHGVVGTSTAVVPGTGRDLPQGFCSSRTEMCGKALPKYPRGASLRSGSCLLQALPWGVLQGRVKQVPRLL